MRDYLSAHTPADEQPYPQFVNLSADGDDVVISVRVKQTTGDGVFICGYAADRGKPGRCTPGDMCCNNYCNMAPEKGAMAGEPLPHTHQNCGAQAEMRLPKDVAIRILGEALAKLMGKD